MLVSTTITVSEIMDALELDEPPEGHESTDTFELRVDVDENEAWDSLPESYKEPEALSSELDQTTVMDLAAAIHRGDRTEAELLLDKLFSGDTNITEWVQLGRYSKKGRVAPEALRKAA